MISALNNHSAQSRKLRLHHSLWVETVKHAVSLVLCSEQLSEIFLRITDYIVPFEYNG